MLRQKIRNFRAMHHYLLADHFNKYVTPKLLCISHIQMTDKSAKRTTKTQTLWTFRKSGQNLGALQLISTDKLNPIKDGRVYHFAECCTSLLRSLIAGVPNVSASYPLTISIFLKNTSRNAAVSDCYTILFSTTSAPLCDLI